MSRIVISLLLSGILTQLSSAQVAKLGQSNITWKRIVLDSNFRTEGVGVGDFNKDGKPDVVVGDCWYEAPKELTGDWKRHILREFFDPKAKKLVPADRRFDLGVYTDSFCCFCDDFNGDGWTDVLVIPFPGNPTFWYENPRGKAGLWKQHLITNSACNETPIFVDLFKTGKKTLVMGWNPPREDGKGNHNDRGEMCYFLPGTDPTRPWTRVSISGPSTKGAMIPGTQKFAHGLGHGDVNADGRIDVLIPQGWWEQPAKIDGTPWKFHAANITGACADMYTYDLDGDGKKDIISTSAHNYGFWWSQQIKDGNFVQRTLFAPPAEVAKLPKDHGLTAKELELFQAVNKLRGAQGLAPWKSNPKLTADARRVNDTAVKDKVRIVGTTTVHSTNPKPYLTRIHYSNTFQATDIAKAAYPDDKLKAIFAAPNLEIGVSVATTNKGQTVSTLVIADERRFSLPSQTHALHMVDIDGDGLLDFVTGRRWWAHGPRGDAGPNDPAYLYWFRAKRGKDGMITFVPHEIDNRSGIGTSFAIADMNGDRLPDVIVANKKGVHVFLQVR